MVKIKLFKNTVLRNGRKINEAADINTLLLQKKTYENQLAANQIQINNYVQKNSSLSALIQQLDIQIQSLMGQGLSQAQDASANQGQNPNANGNQNLQQPLNSQAQQNQLSQAQNAANSQQIGPNAMTNVH